MKRNNTKRKIVRQGESTLMISLPFRWVKKNELKKGDEVDISDEENILKISSKIQGIKNEKEINILDFKDHTIKTILINSYLSGFDKIKINYSHKKTINVINDILRNDLIGFEIIKSNDKSCEIENVTEPAKEQFENILSRLIINIERLYDITYSNIESEKKEYLDLEIKILQYYNFCIRSINKYNKNPDPINLFLYELIKGQREIFNILNLLDKNKTKTDKIVIELLKESKNLFELLTKANKDKNINDLEKLHDLRDEIISSGYDSIEKTKNPIIVMHLFNSIDDYYHASIPLYGFIINKQ